MYYGSGVGTVGLGATSRPGWCPPTSLDPDNPPRDPCETSYKMQMPVIGEGTFKMPMSQMTNDAMYAATQWLPQYLPQYYQQLLPYINAQKAAIMADLQVFVPELIDNLLDEQVMPEVEQLQSTTVAHAENLRDEALLALVGMTVAIVVSVGTAAWWINRKEVMRNRR